MKKELKAYHEDMKRHMGALKEDFQSKLEFVTEKVISIEDKIDIIQTDIGFIKADLNKKANYDELYALERRVTKLESKQK